MVQTGAATIRACGSDWLPEPPRVDQYGQPFAVTELAWTAVGGTINAAGKFTAGDELGVFGVTGRAANHEGTASVRIVGVESATKPTTTTSTAKGEQLLLWSGEVPAQRWTQLYTRVLSKFAGQGWC